MMNCYEDFASMEYMKAGGLLFSNLQSFVNFRIIDRNVVLDVVHCPEFNMGSIYLIFLSTFFVINLYVFLSE